MRRWAGPRPNRSAWTECPKHYGHFLLISIIRNGTAAHKQQLIAELKSHTADLVVHAEGSAVLQLLYSDIASAEQKNEMYRALWGKEITLFEQNDDATLVSLAALFEKDPLCKPRVLQRRAPSWLSSRRRRLLRSRQPSMTRRSPRRMRARWQRRPRRRRRRRQTASR